MSGYSLKFWKSVAPLLQPWDDLPHAERSKILTFEPSYYSAREMLREFNADTLETFYEQSTNRSFRLKENAKQLDKMCDRLLRWSRGDNFELIEYLLSMTSLPQRKALVNLESFKDSSHLLQRLVHKIEQGGLSQQMLNHKPEGVEKFSRINQGWEPEDCKVEPKHLATMKQWIKLRLETGSTIHPLLPQSFLVPTNAFAPNQNPLETLSLAFNYLLAFLVIDPSTYALRFVVVPPAKDSSQTLERLELKAIANPEVEHLHPFADDIESYLRQMIAQPAPLLSSGYGIPVAHHRKVAKGFCKLPAHWPQTGHGDTERAIAAWEFISMKPMD